MSCRSAWVRARGGELYALRRRQGLTDRQQRLVSDVVLACVREASAARSAFVREILVGAFGDTVGNEAWMWVWGGLAVERSPHRASARHPAWIIREPLGSVALRSGNLALLSRLVEDAPPKFADSDICGYSPDAYVSLLCTCASWEADVDQSLVAVSANSASKHAAEGMSLAWKLQPRHADWDVYASELSPRGSRVKEFMMRNRVSEVLSHLDGDDATPPPRRRRMSV
jgi:hypothetical protein